MPRRVQDIVPNDRRSIRDIPVSGERQAPLVRRAGQEGTRIDGVRHKAEPEAPRKKEKASADRPIPIVLHKSDKETALRHMPLTPPTPPKRKPKRKRTTRLLIALGIIVAAAVIAFFASSRFSRATFTIVPKTLSFTATGTYVAHGAPAAGTLSYDLVTLKGSASTTVPAISGSVVSTKAQGTVTVYNAYSAQPVRLIAGTRVAGTSGLVYRLTNSIVIPGYTKPGANVIPGSIQTPIVADQPGDTYNVSGSDSVSDLKIVAYQGTPKYDTIYARLAGSITGGFVGTKKIVSPSVIASTTAALKASITSTLVSELASAIPSGYIMYDGGYATTFSTSTVGGTDASSAVVTLQGTLYGVLFSKSVLIDALSAGKSASAFGGFGYDAPALPALQVSIANLKDFSPDKKNNLVVNVKGDLTLIGSVPVDDIKKKLEGGSLASTQAIFKAYSGVIESGSGELVPPWSKIPTDPDRIAITVQKP